MFKASEPERKLKPTCEQMSGARSGGVPALSATTAENVYTIRV